MSTEACAWAVRQRLASLEEKLVLLLLAIEAGPMGFVPHRRLHDLAAQARSDHCDLPGTLRRLLDAYLVRWDGGSGYWLQMDREADLRGLAEAAEASRVP